MKDGRKCSTQRNSLTTRSTNSTYFPILYALYEPFTLYNASSRHDHCSALLNSHSRFQQKQGQASQQPLQEVKGHARGGVKVEVDMGSGGLSGNIHGHGGVCGEDMDRVSTLLVAGPATAVFMLTHSLPDPVQICRHCHNIA